MNKQTKQIAAALLVLAAVLTSGCADQISEMSADEIASMMEAKQESIVDFSATMVMTSSFGGEDMLMQARMVTIPPDKSRVEYTEPAELAGTVMVTNGSTVWTYDPAKNQVTKMALPEDIPSEMDYTELVKNLLDKNDISLEGTEDVGGRSAYVIKATPKNETISGLFARTRVWVDRENWMLLRMDMYDKDDNLISKVEYKDITFNTGIPDSEFIFEVPAGAEVVETSLEDMMPKKMTLDEARANLTFDMGVPSYLPDGYEFDHAIVIGGEQEVVSLQYTNGNERLYLSESISDDSDRSESAMGEPEIVSINGTDGEFAPIFGMNTLQWSADGIDYSLSGVIEKDEMVNVAESI
ncbi:MAG: outer membrane lipoprotein-sorting protein [Candidatus Methanogaster sp.]|uniref:Outer membrane lipoprotein-sorting protein n=1 Tax=Candidatus Methanogaster sp. TaxID=3386292 RepID=A0AC61KXV1_9EURY|nr:MAG: outer membrane lipoprotein-sorting protein [ANME-2 cluster archaeon]